MYEKMQEFALTEITPLPCTSAVWGQRPVLFHPESPQGVWWGWLQRLTATRQASCLNLEFPRGSPSGWLSWDDLTTAISCLLIWQKAFFFSLMRVQSRMLEWVAMPYSRASSHPRDWTHISFVSCIGRQIVYHYSEKEFILFPLYLPEKGRTVVLGCNIKK